MRYAQRPLEIHVRRNVYLQAEEIIRMVSGDFTSLHHKVLELFVNFSGRVLPREKIACRFEVA